MFSNLFKKSPLKTKLKAVKRAKRLENKASWKNQKKERKEESRILTYLSNNICPKCGNAVKLTQSTERTTYGALTTNRYTCTNCPFEKIYYCDDEDWQ